MEDKLSNQLKLMRMYWEKRSQIEETKSDVIYKSLLNMRRRIEGVFKYKSELMAKFVSYKNNVTMIMAKIKVCQNLNTKHKAFFEMIEQMESMQEDFETDFENEGDNLIEFYYESTMKLEDTLAEYIIADFPETISELDDDIEWLDFHTSEFYKYYGQQMVINEEENMKDITEESTLEDIINDQKLEIYKYEEAIGNEVNNYKTLEWCIADQRQEMQILERELELLKK